MTAYVSAFDLFTIGIGPSSSHTVGPMRAAGAFVGGLRQQGLLGDVSRVSCSLFGSLGSTGLGHGTPDAIVAGLSGLVPETCDPDEVRGAWSQLPRGSSSALRDAGFLELSLAAGSRESILLGGSQSITMTQDDIVFLPRTRLPAHPNALSFTAWNRAGDEPLASETYYSVGGGFIRREGQIGDAVPTLEAEPSFTSASSLLALCDERGLSIAAVALSIETARRDSAAVGERLDGIWAAMNAAIESGLNASGTLPGGLGVIRRANGIRQRLEASRDAGSDHDLSTEWLHAFALAVNEENAAGSRVVTAPTNGAAGIVPAVGRYYLTFVPGASAAGMREYLLTATAIGSLFKSNASISGAEAGCQGEVGSACAMASGALCAVLGGTPRQVENAAEIAMEHHLGLTCDPVGGLVQVPCIERNAIASSTAVSAARLALNGDGSHRVSLDMVIETMRQTGEDMSSKYKETSEAGLAVNVIEC